MTSARPAVLITYDARLVAKFLSQKLQVGLTAENILTPTAEIAQQVMVNFVRLIIGVGEHSLSTLPLSADCDHDPELFRNSIPLVIVYQFMKAFMMDYSGEKLDLTMCDLVTPAKFPQRFRKLTSFLMDFIKLHERAAPLFDEISEEFRDRKIEMESLQEDLINEEKRKNDLISRQNLRRRREHELINDHNKVKGELNSIVNQYTKNAEISADLDKKKKDAEAQIADFEREIITGKKTFEFLTEEVLDSPEELKKEMEQRKHQIAELRECLESSRTNLQVKMEALDICSNSEKNVPVVNERIRIWSEKREEILDLIDAVEEDHRKLESLEEKLIFKQDEKNNAAKQLINCADSHEELRKEHLKRMEEFNGNISDITQQIATLGKNQPEASRDIEKKKHELISMKNIHSQTVAKLSNTCKDTLAKFHKVDALFKEIQRVGLEKKTAGDRAMERLKSACVGRLPSDYTFSTSSINDSENCEPHSPFDPESSVFK